MLDESTPWYREGLRFACRGCGACCRVEGYVWVDREEIQAIADFLDLEYDDFGRRYLRSHGRRYALTEKSDHGCIFWADGCAIYQVRPTQCRTFPFWPEVLKDPQSWSREGQSCHGMGQGRLYRLGEIEQLRKGRDQTADGPEAAATDRAAGVCGCETAE